MPATAFLAMFMVLVMAGASTAADPAAQAPERDLFHCGKTFVTLKLTDSFDEGKGTFRYTTIRKDHIQYARLFPHGHPLIIRKSPWKKDNEVKPHWLEGRLDWIRLVACLN